MRGYFFLPVFLLLTGLSLRAQRWDQEFSRVDSLAKATRYRNDLKDLTRRLTEPWSGDRDKARAIFIWITHHIRYDFKFFNTGREVTPPECKTGEHCGQQYLKWEMNYLKQVAKKGKAVCDGYARLFHKMCEWAGLRSALIEGHSKTKPYQVGMTGPVNHAWNAIWLEEGWQLLDPTWAAGYCIESPESGKLVEFVPSYDDYYWLTPFEDFSRNHYPKNPRWVLEPNYTKEKFAENPYYDPGILSEIRLLAPASGVIRARVGDTLRFRFTYTGNLQQLQVNSNMYRNPEIWNEKRVKRKITFEVDSFALRRQRYVPFTRKGNEYAFEFLVSSPTLYYLEIVFDNKIRAMRFKVKVEQVETP